MRELSVGGRKEFIWMGVSHPQYPIFVRGSSKPCPIRAVDRVGGIKPEDSRQAVVATDRSGHADIVLKPRISRGYKAKPSGKTETKNGHRVRARTRLEIPSTVADNI